MEIYGNVALQMYEYNDVERTEDEITSSRRPIYI